MVVTGVISLSRQEEPPKPSRTVGLPPGTTCPPLWPDPCFSPGIYLEVTDGGSQVGTAGAGLGKQSQTSVKVQNQHRVVLELLLTGQEDVSHLRWALPAQKWGRDE